MVESLRFTYIQAAGTVGGTFLRPFVPITLTNLDRTTQTIGLLDTGADVNVLPYHVGLALGAIWENQRVVAGLSGNLARYEARGIILTAILGEFEEVRLAFAWIRAETIPLILGQTNFFAEFDVCFFSSKGFCEIKPTMRG